MNHVDDDPHALLASGGARPDPGRHDGRSGAGGQTAPAQTLYQRLGGYDGVTAYVALVFPRVAQHADLKHLFRGHGKDSQQRQFQLVVELICQRTGGPCGYVGRAMPPVHDGRGAPPAPSDAAQRAPTKPLTTAGARRPVSALATARAASGS